MVTILRKIRSFIHLVLGTSIDIVKFPLTMSKWIGSRVIQYRSLSERRCIDANQAIIFFVSSSSGVTGGRMQIFSLYRLSKEYFQNTKTEIFMCWLPGQAWSKHHSEGFENDVVVFPLEMVLSKCENINQLLFLLPEYAAIHAMERWGWNFLESLRETKNLKINILNQNIEVMLQQEQVSRIKQVFPDLTSTVANPVWASESERQRLGIPIHILPTWYYPDDAPKLPYEKKRNLMIISPDSDPNRNRVINQIRGGLPNLEIQVISGIKYEEYLKLEKAAKWSLTFGEGFDGYFYGPVFRGGIAFAVRNDTFDIDGLDDAITIFNDYEAMAEQIVQIIRDLDNKEAFEEYNLKLRDPVNKTFGLEKTREALLSFYRQEYTYP